MTINYLTRDYIKPIAFHKSWCYGCAMILVLLYHYSCVSDSLGDLLFQYGYIGVDIFLLLGAYTIGYSYENRSLKEFYIRRLKRIVPLYILFTSIKTILYITVGGGKLSLLEIVMSITGFSYFGILGGVLMEWFLFSLLLLYFCYPCIFMLTKKFGFWTPLLTFLSVMFFYWLTKDLKGGYYYGEWYHITLITRLPIFVLGVYLYTKNEKIVSTWKVLLVGFLAFLLVIYFKTTEVLALSCVSLILLALFAAIYNRLINLKIEILGKYSLEVYIGNCFCMMLLYDYIHLSNSVCIFMVYIVLNIVFIKLMIQYNSKISKLFDRYRV